MPSDSSSLDTLKETLLRAVDAEYNVLKAETVLMIISQLETMQISREQLNITRLGREINSIRQKIDARKKSMPSNDAVPEAMLEIAQRAKKLLRSWQGLLNTSQTNEHHSSSLSNGDSKPRLILKVKLNSPLSKRKHDQGEHLSNGTNTKRRKSQVVPVSTSILPRLKTTQQLLMDMQLHEQRLLPTSTVDETVHRGHELNPLTNHSIHRENSLPTLNVANYLHPIAGPTLSLKPVVKRLSSSFIASTTNCEPPVIAPAIPKKKRRKKSETPESPSSTVEASPSDVASMCASYSTVADLVADHRRRMAVKHDVRELEARPDLLLVPIDQLAIVYERERTRESLLSAQSCSSSMTTVVKLCQSTDLIALPFIDCPLEFDFLLDELVVQQL